MTVTIRHAESEDYDRVISRVDAWWGGRQMAGMLPRLFFTHFRPWTFVAVHDEAIVGFLAGFQSQTDPGQVYCHFIGVAPDWRGRGVGEALYQRLFVAAASQGCHEVLAVTAPTNRGSIAFHARMGFTQWPERAPTGRFRSRRPMMDRARTGYGSEDRSMGQDYTCRLTLIEYVNALWYSPAPAYGRITQIWVLRGTRPVVQRGSDRRIQRPQAARGFCAESRASEPVTERSNDGRAGESETPCQRREDREWSGRSGTRSSQSEDAVLDPGRRR